MSQTQSKINVNPVNRLSAKDIKRVIFERDTTISELVRNASEELGREITPWQMRAVIYRYEGVIYQELREWLARWIGCDVAQIGNEPSEAQGEENEGGENHNAGKRAAA